MFTMILENIPFSVSLAKPSEPTGPLTVQNVQKDSVTLTWKPPTDDGGSPLTGYVILKRDHKRSTWSPAGKCDGSTNEFKVKDLTDGTQYFFKVVAENKAGQSEGLETQTSTLVKSPYGESTVYTEFIFNLYLLLTKIKNEASVQFLKS